jgi:predicted nucleic-acid-binding protein
MKRKFLDANVLLRFLLGDDEKLAQQASIEFEKAKAGKQQLMVTSEVMAEIVYVMLGVYQVPRKKLSKTLVSIAKSEYLEMPDRKVLVDALNWLGETNIDFVDLLLIAKAQDAKAEVLSFNKKLLKLQHKLK